MNTRAISKAESRIGQFLTEQHEEGALRTPVLSKVERQKYRGTKRAKCAEAFWAGCASRDEIKRGIR